MNVQVMPGNSRDALLEPVQHRQAGCVWCAACWVGLQLVHKVIVAAGQLGSLHTAQGLAHTARHNRQHRGTGVGRQIMASSCYYPACSTA
jgi:hypothetical protein